MTLTQSCVAVWHVSLLAEMWILGDKIGRKYIEDGFAKMSILR